MSTRRRRRQPRNPYFLADNFNDTLAAGAVNGTLTNWRGVRVVTDTGNNLSLPGDGTLVVAGGTSTWGETTLAYTPGIIRPSGYANGNVLTFDVMADTDKKIWVGLSTSIVPGDFAAAACEHGLLFNDDGKLDVIAAGTTVKADAATLVNGTVYRVRFILYSAGCFYSISGGAFGTFGVTYTALHESISQTTATLYAAISNYNAVCTVDNVSAPIAQLALSFADYVTGIPLAEATALRDLFRRTTGNNWTNKTNWLSTTTAANWYGVTVAGGHVTQIELNSNNLVGGAGWKPTAFTSATLTLLLYSNASANFNFAIADFPSGLTTLYFYVYSTASVITGAVADFPSGLTTLIFQVNSTSSVITVGAVPLPYAGIQTSLLFMGWGQATVDAYLLRLWTDRVIFTKTLPTLNISTSNAAPSGIYQDGDPPDTGKEYIYELVVDPEVEGFKKWAITYTP